MYVYEGKIFYGATIQGLSDFLHRIDNGPMKFNCSCALNRIFLALMRLPLTENTKLQYYVFFLPGHVFSGKFRFNFI